MAGQIYRQHGAAVMGKEPRLQGPHRVIHAGAMDEDHDRQIGIERLAASRGEDVLAVDAQLHGASGPLRGAQRLAEIVDQVGRVLQPDPAPWVLSVPLVVETTAGTEATTLDVSEAETGFSIRTKDLPLRVLLDPDSHGWRGFAEGEVPPTLDATLHHPGGAVCVLLPSADAGPFAPVRDALRGRPGVAVAGEPGREDDAAYGAEIHLYGRKGLAEPPMRIPEADFAGVATALGAEGIVVRELADLDRLATWSAEPVGERRFLLLDCRISDRVTAPYQEEVLRVNTAPRD